MPEFSSLFTENGGLTVKAVNILSKVYAQQHSDFEKWWRAYPQSDAHAHFTMTRPLRLDYDACKREWSKIVNSGEKSADDLLAKLQADVRQKKINSIQRNELSWFPLSLNYLVKGYWRDSESEEDDGTAADNIRGRIL